MSFFSVEVVPKDPLWKLALAGVLVEQNGFDGVWVSEHFFNRNSLITLATIAKHTRKILLGPAVVNPYVVHPVMMAQQAATLWELSPGRVRYAVGAGDAHSLQRLGYVRTKPVEKVVEAVETMRSSFALLDTYKISDVKIFLGAQGERMLEAAAKIGDGVLVNWSNTEMLKESINHLTNPARPGFVKAAYLITSIHEDEEKALKTVIPYAAYLMVGASEKHLQRADVSPDYREKVAEILARRNWNELYRVARKDWVGFFSFWGNRRQLDDLVTSVIDLGYDEVVFAGPLGPRYVKALKNIASICRSARRRR
ncbi:MAG: LLM class flavin-dependent oxidoreductase [Candidatus Caldarchaeum sp.]|nr:LLM class flavin-dependent oxidoreductase [Candidatus Caldarchaeum sp.]